MIYFTSDLHWGHGNVINFCARPFKDVHDMNESLIKNWNSKIKSTDTVFVLGDMALCSFKEFEPMAKRLNGNKILIRGNHDHYSVSQYNRLGFQVFHEATLKIGGKIVRLSHFPYMLPWYKRLFAFKSELRYLERRPPKIKGEWLLHGHSHVKYKKADDGNRIHIGVDAWNFSPVSQYEIESIMNKSEK